MTVPTNALSYNAYVTQVGVLAVAQTDTVNGVVQGVDADFTALIPQMLDYAELRLQRDLDLNALLTSSSSYSFTSGSNLIAVSPNDFVTVQTLAVNTGADIVALVPTSKEFLQAVYGSSAGAAVPAYFAPYGGDRATAGVAGMNFIVGPWPDQSYPAVITGTQRAPSLYLYSANGSDASSKYTFISTWLPDLLLAASMIYVSAFQRNFGSMADQPAMAMSWEQAYENLLKGAIVEEARKRFQASAWTSQSPALVASPGR